jgi:hypothetical protein
MRDVGRLPRCTYAPWVPAALRYPVGLPWDREVTAFPLAPPSLRSALNVVFSPLAWLQGVPGDNYFAMSLALFTFMLVVATSVTAFGGARLSRTAARLPIATLLTVLPMPTIASLFAWVGMIAYCYEHKRRGLQYKIGNGKEIWPGDWKSLSEASVISIMAFLATLIVITALMLTISQWRRLAPDHSGMDSAG